jgi:hypothetical protein
MRRTVSYSNWRRMGPGRVFVRPVAAGAAAVFRYGRTPEPTRPSAMSLKRCRSSSSMASGS